MSDRDFDIDFDFFDEPATEEATQRRRIIRPGGGSRRPPSSRPPANMTRLLRLVGLVAFVIAAVLFLILWIQGCREESRADKYRDYMQTVGVVAQGSEQVGRRLNDLLTTPLLKQQQVEQGLDRLSQQAEQHVTQARQLDPPGRLRTQHLDLVEALQLRVIGLNRLGDAFRQTARARNASSAGVLLAAQAQRLVASDVVWDDLFRFGATQVMQEENVSGVDVPDSNFVVNADLASRRAMEPVWQRIRGASTGGTPGGLHGTNIVNVRALPADKQLLADQENVVTATADLAFAVTVENGGDHQEVQIPVTLTIEKSPEPVVERSSIDLINPGEQKTVVFRDLGSVVTFAERTTVRVDVAAVPAERTKTNNTAQFEVTFTLVPAQ